MPVRGEFCVPGHMVAPPQLPLHLVDNSRRNVTCHLRCHGATETGPMGIGGGCDKSAFLRRRRAATQCPRERRVDRYDRDVSADHLRTRRRGHCAALRAGSPNASVNPVPPSADRGTNGARRTGDRLGDRHLELTDAGRAYATSVMCKHRLAECLLVNDRPALGGRTSKPAGGSTSARLSRRIWELLDQPTTSPYGNPIPGLAELGAAVDETCPLPRR